MKIVTVIGARPQFIKAVALSKEFRKSKVHEVIVHTGQHYDANMSDMFFKELSIPAPKYYLNINNMPPYQQLGEMIIRIGKILLKENPDYVLVYGDTTSTLAGALAANKLKFKLIHVEAGERSFDLDMPEEVNRILTDRISNILFCASKNATENLKLEHIKPGRQAVHVVGDIMKDTLDLFLDISKKNEKDVLDKYKLKPKRYIVATIHREANTDNFNALKNILDSFVESGHEILFIMHPRTRKVLEHHRALKEYEKKIKITSPVGYLDMLSLIRNSKKVITDSGGMQKESVYLGVPCITIRDTTEWKDTVECGYNVLVGTDKEKIIDALKNFNPKIKNFDMYGDGNSAKSIVKILMMEEKNKD